MAVYEYRCPECGVFEAEHAMGTAPPWDDCATCGSIARRAYSAPNLSRTPRALAEALTRAEKSRDEPEVVSSVPPRRRTRPTPAPAPAFPQGLRRW